MNFIVDENLPPRLAAWLRDRGYDAIHVRDRALTGHPDADVLDLARREARIIVTQDVDFDAPAQRGACTVLRLACGNMATNALLSWLEAQWPQAEAELTRNASCVVLT